MSFRGGREHGKASQAASKWISQSRQSFFTTDASQKQHRITSLYRSGTSVFVGSDLGGVSSAAAERLRRDFSAQVGRPIIGFKAYDGDLFVATPDSIIRQFKTHPKELECLAFLPGDGLAFTGNKYGMFLVGRRGHLTFYPNTQAPRASAPSQGSREPWAFVGSEDSPDAGACVSQPPRIPQLILLGGVYQTLIGVPPLSEKVAAQKGVLPIPDEHRGKVCGIELQPPVLTSYSTCSVACNDELVAEASGSEKIRVFDAQTALYRDTITVPSAQVHAVGASPSGNILYAAEDQKVFAIDVGPESPRELWAATKIDDPGVCCVETVHNIVVCMSPSYIYFFDIRKGGAFSDIIRSRTDIQMTSSFSALCVTDNNVYAGTEDGTVLLFDTRKMNPKERLL